MLPQKSMLPQAKKMNFTTSFINQIRYINVYKYIQIYFKIYIS
jgi:hypothetical protein